MSVVSRNPFDLLGDDGDDSPSPIGPKTTTAAASTGVTRKAPNAEEGTVQRNVPGASAGAGAGTGTGAGAGGRGGRGGRYPSRGGPRNVYKGNNGVGGRDDGPRNTGQEPSSGTMEGFENAAGFDGERIAPSKKQHNGPDKHTKHPGDAPRGAYKSGGHTSRGSGHVRGAKTPMGGGERRQFERRSGGVGDSQKKIEHGWGANEGSAELTAETEGEKDAQAEEAAPQTPGAADADDGGWGAPEVATTAGAGAFDDADKPAIDADETPAEPEEIQKSYDQFLAERTEAALASGFGKKEGRQVQAESLEGTAFVRQGIDDFFSGKEKAAAAKAKAAKKEKTFIEIDGQFASPAGSRAPRGTGERGGRGGGRGGRGGERGGRGGDRGGRGRGIGRGRGAGGFGGGVPRSGGQNLDGSDDKAFPALGA